MTQVAQWVQDLTEDAIGGAPFAIGDRVQHPDGRTVEIIDGRYWGEHGLSNHWTWCEILADGTLSDTPETGYGWRPETAQA